MIKINYPILLLTTVITPLSVAENNDVNSNIEKITIIGKKHTETSDSISKLGLSVKQIPASIDVISGQAIRYRNDLSVLNAVSRSASFVGAGNPGNGGSSISARGFTGQDAVTKLYDGNHFFTLAGTITFPYDTWGIERIEVLKGPASVLHGQGGVAGAYNVIPKSPNNEFGGDMRLTLGQDNQRFFGASLTGELINDVSGRIDYSNSQSDNWVNNGESKSHMLSLAIEWQATSDLTLTFRHDDGDQSPMKYFGLPVVNGDIKKEWLTLNLNASDSRIQYQDRISRIIADWQISDKISLRTEAFSLDTDRYWQTIETYSYDDKTASIQRADPLIIRHQLEQLGLRTHLVFDSSIGTMNWRSSIGVEFTDADMKYTSNFNPTHPNRVDWGGDVDTINPNNVNPGLWSDITDSQAALDQISDVQQMAFFAESQLQITEQLSLVGGIRFDNIETDYHRLAYNESATIDTSVDTLVSQTINPVMFRVGVVYDLNSNTALYAQASTGETHPNGGDVVRVRKNYRDADTVGVEQYEIGLKQSLFNGNLDWNIALFDITKQNLTIDDPDSQDPTDRVVVPEQYARGVELGANFIITEKIEGYANIAILDANRETTEGDKISTPYVAERTINTGLLYSPVDFIRIGADLRYVSERPYQDTPLPAYTILDLSLAWLVNDHTQLKLNAVNVTDEIYASSDHWTGRQWSIGQPRTVSLTLDLNF